MTAIKGTLARLLVDKFDFSTDTAGLTMTAGNTEGDSTTLQATAMTAEPILPNMKIEHNGYITGVSSAGTLENELNSRLGVAGSYIATLFGTDVAACPAYVLDGTFGANMKMAAPAAGLMTLDGAWGEGRGGHRGYRVFSGVISATGSQTPIDIGAAGSNGGEAYLFVQAITGSATNAVIKIQSATTSGGTYADEATFTFSAAGGFKQLMTGTVNEFLKLNCTSLGGATDFTVVLIACVKGVTE